MAALRVLLLCSLALWAGPAAADLYLQNSRITMRMKTTPCTEPEILAHVPTELHSSLLQADVVLDHEKVLMCWAPLGAEIGIVVEDGSRGTLDRALFEPKPAL